MDGRCIFDIGVTESIKEPSRRQPSPALIEDMIKRDVTKKTRRWYCDLVKVMNKAEKPIYMKK